MIIDNKGISLISLLIAIIVLAILVLVLVLKGLNIDTNTYISVFHNNIDIVQEAVQLKMMNNKLKYFVDITKSEDIYN